MNRAVRAQAMLAAVIAAGCSTPGAPGFLGRIVEDLDLERARLTVVYWPTLGECRPSEVAAMAALDEVRRRFDDVRVVTVVPAGGRLLEVRFGVRLPGEVLRADPRAYSPRDALSPRPRVEVWSAAGELLLLKSIPAVAAQAALLTEEIAWTRSFTPPLAAAVRPGGPP